jgi:hypothetical protein
MRSKMIQPSLWVLVTIGVVLSQAGSVYATTAPAVPEVSATSLTTGLAALTGGILILRSWRRR